MFIHPLTAFPLCQRFKIVEPIEMNPINSYNKVMEAKFWKFCIEYATTFTRVLWKTKFVIFDNSKFLDLLPSLHTVIRSTYIEMIVFFEIPSPNYV